MAASIVQSKSAAQNTGLATVSVTWDTPATAGNLLYITIASDDYRTAGGTPSGFTQSTGCGQETFHGHYVWWKVATGGETSVSYTIGSASPSCWITAEISGLESSPLDTSNGQLVQASGDSYTTPTITPTTGDRFLMASMAFSKTNSFTGMDTWLNSFSEFQDIFTTLGSGTRDHVGAATRSVTGDGSTGFSSGSTSAGTGTPTARSGIIIAFKVAGAAAATSAPSRRRAQMGALIQM